MPELPHRIEKLLNIDIAIYQPRMLGDIILGSVVARHLKALYPDSKIKYYSGAKLLLEGNPYIDEIEEVVIPKEKEELFFKSIQKQHLKSYYLLNWLPHPHCVGSFLSQCKVKDQKYPIEMYLSDKEKSRGEKLLKRYPHPRIGIQADWERKWSKREFNRFLKMVKNITQPILIGAKVRFGWRRLNFRESASVLSACDLFLGGVSGLLHAAVAVGTQTIGTPNVYPAEWVMPEFYQNPFINDRNLFHKTILPKKENKCERYNCVRLTDNRIEVDGESHTPVTCKAGFSIGCIQSISADQVIKVLEDTLKDRGL